MSDIKKALDYIDKRMEDVKRCDLEPEIIYYALKAMKENPNLSIEEAFEFGCGEFDI